MKKKPPKMTNSFLAQASPKPTTHTKLQIADPTEAVVDTTTVVDTNNNRRIHKTPKNADAPNPVLNRTTEAVHLLVTVWHFTKPARHRTHLVNNIAH